MTSFDLSGLAGPGRSPGSPRRFGFLCGPGCRVCGCDDLHACEGGCTWIEADLCSACFKRQAGWIRFWTGIALGLIAGLPIGFWLAVLEFAWLTGVIRHG